MDLLNELFFPHDVHRILSSTPSLSLEDSCFWAHSKHGQYEVKSGSELILKERWRLEEISKADKIFNDLKAKVWDIPTVPKIKIFLWRALSGVIAVGESLASHGIQTVGFSNLWVCD